MKKTFKLLGIVALVAAIGFTIIACGGGGGGGGRHTIDSTPGNPTYTGTGEGGEKYTLKIGKSSSRAVSKGDEFTLTYFDGVNITKTSKGIVYEVNGVKLTLEPQNGNSVRFFATISGNSGITEMDGTITWADGTTKVVTKYKLTPGNASDWKTPSTSGQLTVNGLSKYNGKWVLAYGIKESDEYFLIEAFESGSGTADGDFVLNFTKITNGTAKLNVWKIDTKAKDDSKVALSYSGSDTVDLFLVVVNVSKMEGENFEFEIDTSDFLGNGVYGVDFDMMMETVKFSGGKATVTFQSMMP